MDTITLEAAALVVAGFAFLLSLFNTVMAERRQSIQTKLNKRLLAREEKAAREEVSADVRARLIGGGSMTRLRVWNQGKAAARNVEVYSISEGLPVAKNDLTGKFPMARLEQHSSVDLAVAVSLGTPRKHEVGLRWEHEGGDVVEKVTEVTL
ncbi:hypothetical protein DDZ18_08830 [Marinicauda salina]|uniref:Uncharacterized protein n=1 Tax=Marinicauda salina TaxID=2135793 RepID=A0A2U2BUR2_9PROT|nr:hypothetical protein [Marinicauda salina]PWE17748.1 hypothetical protein DDZ18_08830 [Marinicauda salina]